MEVVIKIGLSLLTVGTLSIGAAWLVSDAGHSLIPSPDRRSTLFPVIPAPSLETVAANN